MAILLGILLGVSALAFVLTPLYRRRAPGSVNMQVHPIDGEQEQTPITGDTTWTMQGTQTTEREQSARSALQEIELDYQLGNISESDYTLLRERYMRRALVAMKSRYEQEQELDAAIEEQLRQMKQQEEQRDEE